MNFFKTQVLYFKTKKFDFTQQLIVFKKYYKNPKFAFFDILICFVYLFINPYRLSKRFLQKKGFFENLDVYGETPYRTLHKIISEADLTDEDIFLELGSGRSKTCFFISFFKKCKVYGVEWIPTFVKIANFFKKLFFLENLTFLNKNMFDLDMSKFTFIYLYGTCMEDDEIKMLIDNFKKNVKIVTISYPLSDYDTSFKMVKSFEVEFNWGKTVAYLNVKGE
ncbi:MAG: hypothetical protein JXA94_05230 [Parachlamydiales bacterium]|nr:hypothetical protein [Parachlamydiales bacterium]